VSYALFLAAMTLAVVLRWRWLRRWRGPEEASA